MSVLKINESQFESEVLNSKGKVLVDFYADWCGPCKMLAPVLEGIAAEKPEVKIIKINVDECQNIAAKYGVMSIPTVFIFEDGNEKDHFVGLRSKQDILSFL